MTASLPSRRTSPGALKLGGKYLGVGDDGRHSDSFGILLRTLSPATGAHPKVMSLRVAIPRSAVSLPAALCQDFEHRGEAESALSQQHAGVKPEVGYLLGQRLVAFLGAGEQNFDRLRSHLAPYTPTPPIKQF